MKSNLAKTILLVFVLVFCYQNCSERPFTIAGGKVSDASSLEPLNLSEVNVSNLKFTVDQESEIQKGSQKFYVKTKKLYSLDAGSGVLAEHDQAADTFNTYCLTPVLMSEIQSIIAASSVCKSSGAKAEVCAQVIAEPYAELTTTNEVIRLGAASDACGSDKVDLCDNQPDELKKWIEKVRSQLSQLSCGI